jgi:uncharacterized protein YcsI (UPF0317 family)
VGPTAGLAAGFCQANLVILPAAFAGDFRAFCEQNPQPCPLIEELVLGTFEPVRSAPGGDLRTDLPRYRVFRDGQCTDRPTNVTDIWRDEFAAFLIGCSFTFEAALLAAGLPVRHIEEGRNVPMYQTTRACRPSGAFAAPLVVSMRPMTPEQAKLATQLTASVPQAHGAPVHVGDPGHLGIADIASPDYGEPVSIRAGEIPVFWACGVTPMLAIMEARLEIAITHEPGHMFVTDLPEERSAYAARG